MHPNTSNDISVSTKNGLRYSYAIVVISLLILSPLLFVNFTFSKAIFVVFAQIPFWLILGNIIFSKKVDFFSPLIFILINVALGTSFRAVYMVANPDKWDVRFKFLIDQTSFDFFVFPTFIICLGVILLILGYNVKVRPINFSSFRFMKYDKWKKLNLEAVVLLLTAVSMTFGYLFFQKSGFESLTQGTELSEISQKRFGEIDGKRASYGYYRWLASYIQYSFFFYLAYFAKSRWSFLSLRGVFLGILGIASLIFPILINTRAGVVLNMIIALMIWNYIRGLNVRVLLLPASIAIFLILFLTLSRKKKANDLASVQENITSDLIVSSFLGGRHYLGVAKTAHIMEAVPDVLPYRYGTTMLNWVVAPIPRQLWHSKPNIGHGPEIVEGALHGDFDKDGGVPPGIVGELFWNFGYVGVFVGLFLMGMFLKLIYVSFGPYLRTNLNFLMLYIPVNIGFSFYFMNGSFGDGVINFLKGVVPTIIILFLLQIRKK